MREIRIRMKLDLLTSDRLILRAPGPNDLTALFAIHSDPRTNQHNPGSPMQSLEEANDTLADLAGALAGLWFRLLGRCQAGTNLRS